MKKIISFFSKFFKKINSSKKELRISISTLVRHLKYRYFIWYDFHTLVKRSKIYRSTNPKKVQEDEPLKRSYYFSFVERIGGMFMYLLITFLMIYIAYTFRDDVNTISESLGIALFLGPLSYFGLSVTALSFGLSRNKTVIFNIEQPSFLLKTSIFKVTIVGAIVLCVILIVLSAIMLVIAEFEMVFYNAIVIFIYSSIIISLVIRSLNNPSYITFSNLFVREKETREKPNIKILNYLVLKKDESQIINHILKYNRFENYGNIRMLQTQEDLLEIVLEKIENDDDYYNELESITRINLKLAKQNKKQLYMLQEAYDLKSNYEKLYDALLKREKFSDYSNLIEGVLKQSTSFIKCKRLNQLLSWNPSNLDEILENSSDEEKEYISKFVKKRYLNRNRVINEALAKREIAFYLLKEGFECKSRLQILRSSLKQHNWQLLLCTNLEKESIIFINSYEELTSKNNVEATFSKLDITL
ncbi:MAG: hypothetical protein JEZ05_00570 [Tenericutes bacterium]|nr:hypothetical protein [Mycoplasmatota bacterium]